MNARVALKSIFPVNGFSLPNIKLGKISIKSLSLLNQSSLFKVLMIGYFIAWGAIPWVMRWDNYPVFYYLVLIALSSVPVTLVIADKKNPWWVDWMVTITAITLVGEFILTNVSFHGRFPLEDTIQLTTVGMQGVPILLFGITLGLAANRASGIKKSGRQHGQQSFK